MQQASLPKLKFGKRATTGVSTALLVGLVSIVALVAVQNAGNSTNSLFTGVARTISNDVAGGRKDLPGNDAPIFLQGGSASLASTEDAGGIDLSSVLTANDPDQGQTLTWSLSAPPASGAIMGLPTSAGTGLGGNASPSGVTYMPDADQSGTITATIGLSDGTVSASIDLTITLAAVNDAPDFSIGSSQTHAPNAGAQSISNFASGFTPGPGNESGQSLVGYQVVELSDPQNVVSAVAIDNSGTLTYTVGAASGSATIGVRAQDDGGTANGGTDLSDEKTFTIDVNSAPGEQVYTSAGTYNWVVPGGVTSVSVVAVGGGGGVGLYGIGSNGAAGSGAPGSCSGGDYGEGGSGGSNGVTGSQHGSCGGSNGGSHGGGGSGAADGNRTGGGGGVGAVRIIWPGTSRSFPSNAN